MRTIAIVNQKGGCGKTTTAINLAALYAQRGLRTLLVDMDPQSHCAAGLGVPEARIEYSIGDALIADLAHNFDASQLVWEVARNLHLAPSTVMLSALEAPGGGLHQLPDKDRRLENLLALLRDKYDRCLIDCPPTIGLLTFNALRAAREALIPVETGFFSLRGAEKQWNTIQRMIAHIGRPIACHLLPTLHNPQSQLACNILAALRRQFAGQILPIVIHEDEALREAASFGQPVQEYAPESTARKDFDALADWLEEHAAQPAVQIEVMPISTGDHAVAFGLGGDQSRGNNGGGRAAELARRMHDLAARHSVRPEDPSASQPEPAVAGSREIEAASVAAAAEEIHIIVSDSLLPLPDVNPIEPAARSSGSLDAADSWMQATDSPRSSLAISPAEIVTLSPFPPAEFTEQNSVPPDVSHLYGVRQTSRGVLFVQPGNLARSVSIAGDFNHWSASANPMRFNESVGVFETIIPLPPGDHQYRIVADGEWIADAHNGDQQLNSYGEPNSVVRVNGQP